MAPTLMLYLVRAAALAALLPLASEAQSVTCVACVAIFGLLEQLGNTAAPPEATCKNLTVCDGSCVLFKSWPAASPNFPSDGGPADQRRALQPLPGAALPTRAEEGSGTAYSSTSGPKAPLLRRAASSLSTAAACLSLEAVTTTIVRRMLGMPSLRSAIFGGSCRARQESGNELKRQ